MSFSRAAEQLGLAKARVSTAVQQLEARLGARLLQRTTRSVRLTPEGEVFLDRCKELLAEAEQLEAMFQPAASGLTGRLRIDMPSAIARDVIIARLSEFLAAHPLLSIGISTTYRRVDLGHEGSVRTLPMHATVTVNGTDAYVPAALAGLGLIQAQAFGAHPLIDAGRLVEVLPQFTASPLQVSLL